MSAYIVPYGEKYSDEVRDIFFESSTRKDFKDDIEKENFYYKYVGLYLKHFPEYALVATEDKVLGYVVASPVSEGEEFQKHQQHLGNFKDHFKNFPAHLHINCHFDSRGKGIGSKLIGEVERKLQGSSVKGLHIITGSNSVNQSFYKKLGFTYEVMEDFEGFPLLLMGKSL